MQTLVQPLSSSVTLDKAFNLSAGRDRGCHISFCLATFCRGILNCRKQVLKEQRYGIQTRVLILVHDLVCMTLNTSFHPLGLAFASCISH